MTLVKKIYEVTRSFPTDEKFGLVAQMRRTAVSIPSNIAEGQARKTTAEFVRFVSDAEGSLAELDTQLTLSVDLGFCNESETADGADWVSELKRMLNALRRSLEKDA